MTKYQPGDFLCDLADVGSRLVASLASHANGDTKVLDLTFSISLSCALSMDAGKEVNNYSNYFKENFQSSIDVITCQSKKDFEAVQKALDIIDSYSGNGFVRGINGKMLGVPPEQLWKKILWASEMNERDWGAMEEKMTPVTGKAWLVRYLVSLVVIQKNAQL
jgi:hypothetical protein